VIEVIGAIKTGINSQEKGQLPKVIEDFIDGADKGIILFTMGFIFNPSFVPQERIQALLKAFSRQVIN